MSLLTSARRFYDVSELLSAVALHLAPEDYRRLATTCSLDHRRFNGDAWSTVDGFGNLLALLHDSHGVQPVDSGLRLFPIEEVAGCEFARVNRFVERCGIVKHLNMFSNPDRWTWWTRFEELNTLHATAGGRLFPVLESVTVHVNGVRKMDLAPMIDILANPHLRKFHVTPNIKSGYISSAPSDVTRVLQTIHQMKSDRQLPPFDSLSLFPEKALGDGQTRAQTLLALVPLIPSLQYLAISHWVLTLNAVEAMATASLRHLLIHGRFAVDAGWLQDIPNVDVPEDAFAELETLELKHIPLPDVIQFLLVPQLLSHVRTLRVATLPIVDLDQSDDEMYMSLFSCISGTLYLDELVIMAHHGRTDMPYWLSEAMTQILAVKPLEVICLYNLWLPEDIGFSCFYPDSFPAWENLVQLAIMRHDLLPRDLIMLARCPRLRSISGNISARLGQSWGESIAYRFAGCITLGTRFEFGEAYTSCPTSRAVIVRIALLLLELCAVDLVIDVDRQFRQGSQADVQDMAWGNGIIRELQLVGLTACKIITPQLGVTPAA